MPHGHWTPLGRLLRSVLRPPSPSPSLLISTLPLSQKPPRRVHPRPSHAIRDVHDWSPKGHDVPSQTEESGEAMGPDGFWEVTDVEKSLPQNKWKRWTSHLITDQVSQAVEDVDGDQPHAHYSKGKHAPRDFNPEVIKGSKPAKPTLQGILARYIREEKGARDVMQADWESSFVLTPAESALLHRLRFSHDDLHDWAEIVLAVDNVHASRLLVFRLDRRADERLFILMHFLRREYISAHALRNLITSISNLLQHRSPEFTGSRRETPSLLLAVNRLLRHAREVWPQSMPAIVSIFLGHLRHQDATLRAASIGELQFNTFALNKLMSWVSLSTALMPFKDNVFQEMAIIPILQYMDAHDPPLQITRPGYRAVIRIQLAQQKTEGDRRWAELKALSWPPWKVDRTAMDASVGLEYGITRARATLFSMRSAGYRPLTWEKAAELYTGWDADGTPTVQRRVMLGSPASTDDPMTLDATHTVLERALSVSSESQESVNSCYWAARIDSTRTIQEAWACYLAWEDAKLPPDQNVYLTIMQKLDEATNTQHDQEEWSRDPAWDLLPGDTPRLSPLPPSTHLYTYTRTAPPSLDDFYHTLRKQGIRFTGHALAYVLRKSSLRTGLKMMKGSVLQYPDLWGVLVMDDTRNLDNLPPEIFTAAVQLLARSGGYFLHDRRWRLHDHPPNALKSSSINQDGDRELASVYQNKNSVIVRAIDLLRRRPNCGRQTWVAVFVGLTRESNYQGLGQALDLNCKRIDMNPPPEVGHLGALLTYSMTRDLIKLYREQFSDLDPMAFHRFCLATESMVRAVWTITTSPDENEGMKRVKSKLEKWEFDGKYIINGAASRKLREEFKQLVGFQQDDEAVLGGAKLPRLLFIPNPALLHVYIRALGWAGNFPGLLEVVTSMRAFRQEIEERKERDRLGRDMMRKVMVALRVFLERSWRDGASSEGFDARLAMTADRRLVEEVRRIVESVEEWEGWATDDEVGAYVAHRRFDGLRGGDVCT